MTKIDEIKTFQTFAYALYKCDWEDRISLDQKLEKIRDFYEFFKENFDLGILEANIEVLGYNGEIYVSREEFLDNEFLDEDYMKSLLKTEKNIKKYYAVLKEMEKTK